jgi:hypothetical protein
MDDVFLRVRNIYIDPKTISGNADPFTQPDDKAQNVVHAASVTGDKMDIIPVEVIQGDEPLTFFLLKWFDQVLCVTETGEILWARNFFFAHQALLYDQVLIIVDTHNAVGIDVTTGEYLWSLSSNEPEWDKNVYRELVHVAPVKKNLAILANQTLYLIDPKSGYPEKKLTLPEGEFVLSGDGQDYFYLRDRHAGSLLVGEETGNLQHYALAADGEIVGSLLFGEKLIFWTDRHVHLFSMQTGKIIAKIKTKKERDFFVERYRDSLLLVYPGLGIEAYLINGEGLQKKWEYLVDVYDANCINNTGISPLWSAAKLSYVCIDERAFFVTKRNDIFTLKVINLDTGAIIAEVLLDELSGNFEGIVLSRIKGGTGFFTILLTCGDSRGHAKVPIGACVQQAWLPDLHVYSCAFDLNTGTLHKLDAAPKTFKAIPSQLPSGTVTENRMITVINGQYLFIEPFEKWQKKDFFFLLVRLFSVA